MRRTFFATLIFLAPALALGAEPDAKTLAQEILDKGSALFDTRDAAAMAATYRDSAEIHLITRSRDSSEVKTEVRRGKAEIESGYADVFKDRKPETKSKNVVEYATFLASDVMVIHGTFHLDTAAGLKVSFVQLRVKVGGQWLIQRLELIYVES